MASTINASTVSGIVQSADTSGVLALQTGGTTALSIDTSQNVTFTNGPNLPNTFGFKNRIINGGMVIDQRNAGASTAIGNEYNLDRWYAQSYTSGHTVQRVADAPTGFTNSQKITIGTGVSPTASSYFRTRQCIEGYNCADLGWGTANAKTVTVSFWVKSSVAGTYGVGVQNDAASRAYIGSYVVSSANTWEYKSVVIPGDTTGTWETTNGGGIWLGFDLGEGSDRSYAAGAWNTTPGTTRFGLTGGTKIVATTGATFYVTGVQLELGSTATSFDFRDYGRELMLCQRYYEKQTGANCAIISTGYTSGNANIFGTMWYKVSKRTAATTTILGTWTYSNASGLTVNGGTTEACVMYYVTAASPSASSYAYAGGSGVGFEASAEL